MSKLTDQIDSDDVDVVRAVARELVRDLSAEKATNRDAKELAEVLNRLLQTEKKEREAERAMWRENVEALKSTLRVSEHDVAALQSILGIVCSVGSENLPALLEWVWNRSTPEEMISMRKQRDKLWEMVGIFSTWPHDREKE